MGVSLRVVAGDASALTPSARSLAADVALVRNGPRGLRWRTPAAELARRLGLFYVAGGGPGVGNLVLASMRVAAHDTWCVQFPLTPGRRMRGAALARCSIGGTSFVVAASLLAPEADERPTQAAILATVLSEVDDPLVALAQGVPGLTEAGPLVVDPRVSVASHEQVGAVSVVDLVLP